MAKDQDGGFAGDAGDFAELEVVGDEISEKNNGLGRKLLDVFGEGARSTDGERSF